MAAWQHLYGYDLPMLGLEFRAYVQYIDTGVDPPDSHVLYKQHLGLSVNTWHL